MLTLPEIATVGGGITVITTEPLCGWLQPGVPVVATLTRVKVVVEVNVLVRVALPEALSIMVWFPAPETE
jgi:hypothetical protein